MIHELIPHVRCISSYPDIEAAIEKYPETYIATPEGTYFKHVKLPQGRHVRLKVAKLPEIKIEKDNPRSVVVEEINFLPAGKIPSYMFDQIVEFFRQVIYIKKASFEAHAWILWNQEKGYYISVPPQRVGGASVNFEYTKGALPEGDVIVVDLHSHGQTMGAFWSQTDNQNDASGIYYSGVIGKIQQNGAYEWVMRFNLYDQKKDAPLEEVFEFPEVTTPTVPEDWLEQVVVNSPRVMTAGKWVNQMGGPATPSNKLPDEWKPGWFMDMEEDKEEDNKQSRVENDRALRGRILQGKCSPKELQMGLKLKWITLDQVNAIEAERESRRVGKKPSLEDENLNLLTFGKITPEEFQRRREEWGTSNIPFLNQEDELELQAEMHFEEIMANPITGLLNDEDDDFVPGPLDKVESTPGTVDDESSYYTQKYSLEVAEAKDSIDIELGSLAGCDEALVDIIRQAYEMLSEPGRSELAANGF